MVEVSPKFVGKDVEVWCKAIAHELAVGEIIWAFVSASDTRPATIATVITNSRIAGFYPSVRASKRLPTEVPGDRIRSIEFPSIGDKTHMTVLTEDGQTDFGEIDPADIDFARYYVEYLRNTTTDAHTAIPTEVGSATEEPPVVMSPTGPGSTKLTFVKQEDPTGPVSIAEPAHVLAEPSTPADVDGPPSSSVPALSPKIKEKKAAKWTQAITPDLYAGESIWAFVNAARFKPATVATAITNARIIGFTHFGQTTDKRILLEVAGDQIRGLDFSTKGGLPHFRIQTDAGEVDFGSFDANEVDFARHYAEYLWHNGIDPVAQQAAMQQRQEAVAAAGVRNTWLRQRDAIPVFGTAMKDKWWDDISRHSRPEELPWFVINSGMEGRLVAFEDRLLISKKGFMSASLGGSRETIFLYSDITNIEYNSGFMNGVLEVLTPSYQGTANHDYWRSSGKSRNSASDDPRTLSNCLPLIKVTYREAQPMLNELQQKIAASKRTQVIVHHASDSVQPAGPAPVTGLADELAKLADMHQRGILDDDEFKAAKGALIARMS
ncbi:SHOCT domain-containing protein [Gordonia sp. NB41Y]|uniref:SHOCT domain-containing protein n=1 Tax=Gordonia sp. NB41Y TaxID=875808 RepID=UPI00273BA774|nr:SHOCT domain-containing protein [Gordonia sp. NB41Y]WLP90775.1 SHOCT domain-containing protein [Gordonia sp. NB41Y]